MRLGQWSGNFGGVCDLLWRRSHTHAAAPLETDAWAELIHSKPSSLGLANFWTTLETSRLMLKVGHFGAPIYKALPTTLWFTCYVTYF